jgi:hypothetical protein
MVLDESKFSISAFQGKKTGVNFKGRIKVLDFFQNPSIYSRYSMVTAR